MAVARASRQRIGAGTRRRPAYFWRFVGTAAALGAGALCMLVAAPLRGLGSAARQTAPRPALLGQLATAVQSHLLAGCHGLNPAATPNWLGVAGAIALGVALQAGGVPPLALLLYVGAGVGLFTLPASTSCASCAVAQLAGAVMRLQSRATVLRGVAALAAIVDAARRA